MEFATYSQRLEAKTHLITEYKAFKEQEQMPTNIVQINDCFEEEENVLLATMYEPIQESNTNNEIQAYLTLPRIPSTQYYLTWWNSQRSNFSTLSKIAQKYLIK
ncbi:33277_t:CDS:1, partial [Racocetra persica]